MGGYAARGGEAEQRVEGSGSGGAVWAGRSGDTTGAGEVRGMKKEENRREKEKREGIRKVRWTF